MRGREQHMLSSITRPPFLLLGQPHARVAPNPGDRNGSVPRVHLILWSLTFSYLPSLYQTHAGGRSCFSLPLDGRKWNPLWIELKFSHPIESLYDMRSARVEKSAISDSWPGLRCWTNDWLKTRDRESVLLLRINKRKRFIAHILWISCWTSVRESHKPRWGLVRYECTKSNMILDPIRNPGFDMSFTIVMWGLSQWGCRASRHRWQTFLHLTWCPDRLPVWTHASQQTGRVTHLHPRLNIWTPPPDNRLALGAAD